jgi:protein-S-isoprenylcysteine O-methyltransferase Ste14
LQVRLILGEEAFLGAKLGAPYAAYCALVPRVWPSLKAKVPGAGQVARWGQAFLGEIYFWGVACSFAFAGWRYNASLLMQCVVVSFGLALVGRAFVQGVGDRV